MRRRKKAQFSGYRSDISTPISLVSYFKEESKGFDVKFFKKNKPAFAGRY